MHAVYCFCSAKNIRFTNNTSLAVRTPPTWPTAPYPSQHTPAPRPTTHTPSGWPRLRLGFRPFYLGAALFALLAILLWVAIFLGQLELTMALPPMLWHAHEVLFGFAIAVIVGFLLTAVKAWTGLTTPRGAFLGALAW